MSEKKPEDYLCVQSAATLKLEAELSHTATLETITTLLAHIATLEAQLAEVAELPEKWRDIEDEKILDRDGYDGHGCANELTAILAKYSK